MPILYTGGKCILADTFQDAVESIKDTDVIADLSRDKHVLSRTLTNLSEEIDALNLKIAQLKKEKEESIPMSVIEKLIENALKNDQIPIPSHFGKVVDVTCSNVTFLAGSGLCADVTFVDTRGSLILAFTLTPTPADPEDIKEYFPDFHMGYSKPKAVKKESKTNLSTPSDVSKESGCSGNPS